MELDIVITMGGAGSRFRKAGYDIPKYMIEVRGKTLFEWSMLSLKGYEAVADRYIFVAMRDVKVDAEEFIREKCLLLGIKNYKIIILEYLTDGQADTAMMAEQYWQAKHGLLVYNIDTYVESDALRIDDIHGDGFIPCFRASGRHWSFVRIDGNGRAVEIREKEKISDNCTIGAYYFSSCELYSKLYHEFYADEKVLDSIVNREKYIAPLYNYLLSQGGEIYIADVPAAKVHVLGTPEELEKFRKQENADD